jgi:hypothetical protein
MGSREPEVAQPETPLTVAQIESILKVYDECHPALEKATSSVATLPKAKQERPCDRCRASYAPRVKGQRFCSRACRTAWWDEKHPRLNAVPPEGQRSEPLWRLLLGALADGKPHTAHELAIQLRADKHVVVARLSMLKGRGHDIRSEGNYQTPHRYWLVVSEAR